MSLIVREIFYSLQGEGGRQGEASIFIRLANCNLNCWFCDTDWSKGDEMTIEEILSVIEEFPCDWIVWTGGEPTIQLTDEIVSIFRDLGYSQAIETNGTNKAPLLLDYVTVSPKKETTIQMLWDNFPHGVDEFRYPLGAGEQPPPRVEELPHAQHYFISPLFMGEKKKRFDLNEGNVAQCVDFVKKNPDWKLSLQMHKIINVR
jgi:7-carboxy-7-deazaguanine synthase